MSFLNALAKKAQQAAHTVGHDVHAVAHTASRAYDQANVFDNGLSYQTRQVAPNAPQRSVVSQAAHIGYNTAKPVVQVPVQFAENYANTFANVGNRLAGAHNRTIQQNMGGNAALNKTLQFSSATGRGKQLAGDVAQVGLSALPGAGQGAKLAFKVAGGSALGAGFNAASAAGDGGTKKDIIKSAVIGGALGGAIPALPAATRQSAKLAQNGLEKGAGAVKSSVNEATGRTFNGLPKHQIITDTNHLKALDSFQEGVYDQKPLSVKAQQDVVNTLHDIKNKHGLDFITGSNIDRANRIAEYYQQWDSGLKKYQDHLMKPSISKDEAGAIGKNIRQPNPDNLRKQLGTLSNQMKATQGTPKWNSFAQKADQIASQLDEADIAHLQQRNGAKPPSKRSLVENAAQKAKGMLTPLDESGHRTVAPEAKLVEAVQNKLTKGAKAGRQNLSPEVQAGVSGEHTVRNTQALQDEALAQANSLPIDKHIQAAHEALAVPAGKIDDKTVALAQQAIERADAAGRHEDAVGIHDALSEHLVKQGQTIQAASLLYRLSPQGLFYKGLKDLKKGGANVTPELEAKLRSYADQAKSAKNLDDKERAMAQFHKTVADNMPKSAANGVLSVWKAGLLSGVKTQGGNFVSNATFGTLHSASNPIAAGVDKLISLKTGQRTKTATLRGLPQGTAQGVRTGIDTMKTGIDARNIGGGKYEVHGELNFKNPVIQNVFGKTSNLVFRGMNAADQPFYYAALKNNLADLAKADGINKGLKGSELNAHIKQTMANPTQHMAETAKVAAQKSVLAQDSKIASSLTKFTQAHPSAQVLAPFIKVPTNFLTRTLDYTPVGAIKEAAKQIQAGKLDQRALSEAIGEATTGSAVIFLGAQLANHNLLSGQYPQNDQKESARWKAEGIQPNSVKVGHTWIGLNYLGPVGLLFGAGKDYVDAAKRGDNGTVQAITGFGKNLTGQSFLTGFSGFANAIQDPQRSAKSFINSQAGSIVPTWSADLANFTDKYQREVNSVGDSIKSRLPAARNTLPVKQDVYGNQLTQRTGAVNQLLNPLKPSDGRTNSVIGEVSRLHSADPNNKDLQVTPTPVSKTLKVNGQDIKLNSKQVHDLQNAVGQYTQQKWGELIKTPEYQAMDDTQKAAALDNLRKTATEVSTRDYVVKNNIASYDKSASKKAIQLANGDKSIADFAKTSKSGTATKPDFNKSNDTEYKYLQSQYDDNVKNNKFTSDASKIKAETNLNKAKIGSGYSNQVRQLYTMTKSQLYSYLISNPNGKNLADQLVSYGDALESAGIGTNKLRSANGNVSIAPATKKTGTKKAGTLARKTSTGKVSKAKTAKYTLPKYNNSSAIAMSRSVSGKVRSSTVKSSGGNKKIAFSSKIKQGKTYKLAKISKGRTA